MRNKTELKKNEIVTVTVTALTNEGCGIGRWEGMVIFIPFSAVGDLLRVRIVKVGRTHCYGKIEEILTPSSDRVPVDCPVFGRCGGCDFRHLRYEAELSAKEGFLRDAFTRIGRLDPEFLPILPNASVSAYRNKTQYPVRKGINGTECGFFAERSHRIVPCGACRLEPSRFEELRGFILDLARENRISAYDEETHSGVLRSICIRRGYHSGEVGVSVVVRRFVPELKKLGEAVHARFPEVVSVTANVNPERTNVILGEDERLLYGTPYITDTMCGKTFRISARSFYQVNTPMAEALYREAAKLIEPDGKTVVDLYCGAGTIGLTVADRAKRVIGVEQNESAVENARENARLNGAENVRFLCGDAGEATERLTAEGVRADAVIVDPARKGCDPRTIENIVKLDPARIAMISCNPATAARDCKLLSERGYRVETVRGVDLFSRTRHVETVVLMSRAKD
ncbi:MAG: 23S rRNA (uracil(1939)-C(5))-methyltransferase RlmD [Bacteroides sp.]|nr:23S rRNA (uracil(1939)-C(5))-methyltransferase RlmD [Eubacterium sp.]MCM1418288.1 23S rRNA (uracil(1939)-C(5))-methyltransferase RlmD [Roseburia sp.]MCM1462391.1 23S rRNA (uracil(1939)-C(5))-methyltransferase RlmD [Bacteroides sp.]